MIEFIAGMITMGYVLAGLFFLKFWARSGDRLFVKFAVAFWLLAINEAMLAAIRFPEADESWPYLLHLLAFALIAVAILQKNAGRRPRAKFMPPGDARGNARGNARENARGNARGNARENAREND